MPLNQVNVTGTIPGANVATLVTFTPSTWVQDATDSQTLPPAPDPVYCNSSGYFSVELDATDNNVTPSNWYWTVTMSGVPNVATVSWSFFLLHANGGTQDLSTLVAITPPAPLAGYMPLPSGTPAVGQVPVVATNGSPQTQWGTVLANPMTTLGDLIVGGASGAPTRLGANSTGTRKFLRDVSSGAPAWDTLQTGDIPALPYDASGAAATAQSNAQAFATSAVATETTRAEAAEALALQKSNNLSDVASATTARTNLGIPGLQTLYHSTLRASHRQPRATPMARRRP